MTQNTHTKVQPTLSMFDVYNGYVLTQGHNALQNVVFWERVMRSIAVVSCAAIAMLWFSPDAATGPQVLPLKLILSLVLGGMAGMLFWAARTRPQYESQVNLIKCELRQVIRAASGMEQQMLRIGFGDIRGLFVKRNRANPDAACLFVEIDGADEAVLLGVGQEDTLVAVHRRLSDDLAKARTLPRPSPSAKPRAVSGMQAA